MTESDSNADKVRQILKGPGMTLTEYLTEQCKELVEETEDFKDALDYVDDIVSDAQDEFPSAVDEDIEIETIRILKEMYDGPDEGETQTLNE